MPYIGNQPTNSFTSFAKQDITGNGGTGYTLNHPVSNANDIAVFLNNVRQEPTEAYSASDTTLTMTDTIQSSDNFYILFLGQAIQTSNPPDGSVSASKIIDGSVSASKIVDGSVSTLKIADDSVTNAKTNFISTSSAPGLEIKGDGTLSGTTGTLQLNCSANSHGVKIKSPPHSAVQSYTLTLPSTAPSAGKALITDGNGNLSFDDAGASVEEGTWTPNMTSLSESIAIGRYLKIGKMVTIQCTIVGSSAGNGLSITISGLPFTSNSTSNFVQSATVGGHSRFSYSGFSQITATISTNSTTIGLNRGRSGGTFDGVQGSQQGYGTQNLYIGATYIAN